MFNFQSIGQQRTRLWVQDREAAERGGIVNPAFVSDSTDPYENNSHYQFIRARSQEGHEAERLSSVLADVAPKFVRHPELVSVHVDPDTAGHAHSPPAGTTAPPPTGSAAHYSTAGPVPEDSAEYQNQESAQISAASDGRPSRPSPGLSPPGVPPGSSSPGNHADRPAPPLPGQPPGPNQRSPGTQTAKDPGSPESGHSGGSSSAVPRGLKASTGPLAPDKSPQPDRPVPSPKPPRGGATVAGADATGTTGGATADGVVSGGNPSEPLPPGPCPGLRKKDPSYKNYVHVTPPKDAADRLSSADSVDDPPFKFEKHDDLVAPSDANKTML